MTWAGRDRGEPPVVPTHPAGCPAGVQLHVRQHTGDGTYRQTARQGMAMFATTKLTIMVNRRYLMETLTARAGRDGEGDRW
jgi:hypothetical protein